MDSPSFYFADITNKTSLADSFFFARAQVDFYTYGNKFIYV